MPSHDNSLLHSCSLDTILKLLQITETQRMKDKKETIAIFRISLTSSHFKSPQSPIAYVSLVITWQNG